MFSIRSFLLAPVLIVLATYAADAQLLVEDFSYPAGDALTAHGYAVTSGSTTNAITVVSPGLSFAGYIGSGIGNAAGLVSTGQDVNIALAGSVTGGSVYASFLVNVAAAQAGDYFFHLIQGPVTSNVFCPKVFVRMATNGNLTFGVSKRSNTAALSDSIYSTGTTYLMVVKYTFFATITPTVDDSASLFIFAAGPIPTDEPATPTVGPVGDTAPDATSIDFVGLRQGAAANGPTLTIDGIRVGTSWVTAPLPITLASFVTMPAGNVGVKLEWTTLSEVSNYGFEVQKSRTATAGFTSIPNSFVPGHGTTLERQSYEFTDVAASPGVSYYRLKQTDRDGTIHFSDALRVEVGASAVNPDQSPGGFALTQNYPNPFNPSTKISYSLPLTSMVSLRVFNLLGQEVAVIVHGEQEAGSHEVDFAPSNLASGVYVYRLTAGTFTQSKRLLLMR
jgi:hypothetical protein